MAYRNRYFDFWRFKSFQIIVARAKKGTLPRLIWRVTNNVKERQDNFIIYHKTNIHIYILSGFRVDYQTAIIANMQSRSKSSRQFWLNFSRGKLTIGSWIDGIYHVPVWEDHLTNKRAGKSEIWRGLWSQLADIKTLQKNRGRRATHRRWKISMETRTNTSAEICLNEKIQHLQGRMQGVD